MPPTSNPQRPTRGELDPRKAAILDAVVSEYIADAQPVGSQTVASATDLDVSSATIRTEMVALERDGYLVQPHTSAGRIPTDKGYRHFVDQLAPEGSLGAAEQRKVASFFDQVHGEMEEMMEHASGLLSELTSYAAVVLPPGHEAALVRSVQLVSLGGGRLLVIAVLSDGIVEKRLLEVDDEPGDELLHRAAHAITVRAVGKPLGPCEVAPTMTAPLDHLIDHATRAIGTLGGDSQGRVFVGGGARVAEAFDAVETVRSVLTILERQLVVVSLLRDVLNRGLSVAIGSEHGYEPLASCSVVVAPVHVEGREVGAVGVLGPTRMHYKETLAAANTVSRRLSEKFSGRAKSKRKDHDAAR